MNRRCVAAVAGFVLLIAFPGNAPAHPLDGHFVVGASVIIASSSGWRSFAVSAYEGAGDAGGTVVVDNVAYAVECADFDDQTALVGHSHYVIVGWRIGTQMVRVDIATETSRVNPQMQIFTVTGAPSPCGPDASLGGLASGPGQYLVGPLPGP